jgi:hypothetical protein
MDKEKLDMQKTRKYLYGEKLRYMVMLNPATEKWEVWDTNLYEHKGLPRRTYKYLGCFETRREGKQLLINKGFINE